LYADGVLLIGQARTSYSQPGARLPESPVHRVSILFLAQGLIPAGSGMKNGN
jgi:hypothetical protein